MVKFTYLVLTNAVPGREEEFNRWYTEQHLPDVLRVPRGERTALQSHGAAAKSGASSVAYLALYNCEAADPQVVTDGIQARVNTAEMQMSDTVGDVKYGCYFEPITEVIQ
jgi:hypothetical protein